MNSMIVCGWYTPDYKHWTERLIASLQRFEQPHEFAPVEKAPGGWEANTLRKADQILAAMDRHPNRTIVFLDVDCEVLAPLNDLAAIKADFAVHLRAKSTLKCRSGTMVIAPTDNARALIRCWARISAQSPPGTVDQQTLLKAMFRVPGITISSLDVRYCAVAADKLADPVILHNNAAADQPKVPAWRKRFHALRSRLVVEVSA